MPLLSVIIPVYNAGKYVLNAIESVLNQKVTDFELILINDGSTDNSLEIINKAASKDKRIKVFSTKNSGPAAARNFGIDKSEGKYLMFLDSDDSFTEDAFEVIETYLDDEPQMLIFGFYINNIAKGKIYSHVGKENVIDTKTQLKQVFGDLYENNQFNSACTKTILSDTVKNNRVYFENYRYGEDRLFVLDVLSYCEKVKVIDKCLYEYKMINAESLTTKFYDMKFEACNLIDDRIVKLQEKFGEFDDETKAKISYMYLKSVVSCMTNLFHSSCKYSFKEKKKVLDSMIKDNKVKKAVNQYKRHDIAMDIIVMIMKTESTVLNMLTAKAVSFFSIHLSAFVLRLKHPSSVLKN